MAVIKNDRSFLDNYNLDTRDKIGLVEYYDNIETIIKSPSSVRIGKMTVKCLLRFISEKNIEKPLEDWRLSDYADFFGWLGYRTSSLRGAIVETRRFLAYNNIPSDECSAKEILKLVIPNDYIVSFDELNNIIVSRIMKDYPHQNNPDMIIDKNTSARACLYLAWLGITEPEIENLTLDDVNTREKRIVVNNRESKRYISYSRYIPICSLFAKYASINGYDIINKRSATGICFSQFKKSGEKDMLIRNIVTSNSDISSTALKAKRYFGLAFCDVLWSGKLFRLYEYEKNGGDTSDIESVSKILGVLKTSQRMYLYRKEYEAFKKKRIAMYPNGD